MICHICGDLDESPSQVLAIPVYIDQRVPDKYVQFIVQDIYFAQTLLTDNFKNGIPELWESEDRQFLNIPLFARATPHLLQDIDVSLGYIVRNYQAMGINSIAFPPIGCSENGVDYWEELKSLFEKHFSKTEDLDVYVHLPEYVLRTT